MQNDQYDPRLAGYVRALSFARAWTDPSWKMLILVGFIAAPTVHFLTNSMAWLIGIAAIGFIPLVVCIAIDVLVGMKLTVLTSRDEFHMLQQAVDREVASMTRKVGEPKQAEPIVKLPSVTPIPRVPSTREQGQETTRS